jgi:hypothetical protein
MPLVPVPGPPDVNATSCPKAAHPILCLDVGILCVYISMDCMALTEGDPVGFWQNEMHYSVHIDLICFGHYRIWVQEGRVGSPTSHGCWLFCSVLCHQRLMVNIKRHSPVSSAFVEALPHLRQTRGRDVLPQHGRYILGHPLATPWLATGCYSACSGHSY